MLMELRIGHKPFQPNLVLADLMCERKGSCSLQLPERETLLRPRDQVPCRTRRMRYGGVEEQFQPPTSAYPDPVAYIPGSPAWWGDLTPNALLVWSVGPASRRYPLMRLVHEAQPLCEVLPLQHRHNRNDSLHGTIWTVRVSLER